MNISQNIHWIFSDTEHWSLYTNKSYQAYVQKANPEKIYNVPGKPGVVYNFLEDAYEKVNGSGFIITGCAGEMWNIGVGSLAKYPIRPEDVTDEPQAVMTLETGVPLAGILIPKNVKFTLEVDYGEKAVLRGNRDGLNHADGDYILTAVKEENGVLVPDFTDSGRIVNGAVFQTLYKPYHAE